MYLSIHLSIYPSIHLPIYSSIHLSIYSSIHLSIYPSIHLSIDLSLYRSIDRSIYLSLSIYLCMYLPIYLPTYLPIYLSTYLSICLSIYLSICLSIYLSVCKLFWETSSIFALDNVENKAILRDFLIFWSWQRQKQSNSASLPHFLKLATWKTKHFCETSFKNDQKWKLIAELTASYQCVLRFFQSIRLNYCACHEKWCQVIRSAAPVTQNHPGKPEDLMLQNATPLRKSAPGPPHRSDEHVSCTAPATEKASLQILCKCPTPAMVFGHAPKPSRFAHFWQGAQSLAPATRNDIWTSKSGPNPCCFLTFWLRNVLRATTACTFSTSQLPKVVRTWYVLYILTSKCASRHTACTFSASQLPKVLRTWGVFSFFTCKRGSRHNGVHFFISHLARWLRPRRFSEPTFRPSGATNHGKNTVFPDFLPFRASELLSSDSCSSLIFSLLLFSSLWLFPSLLFICPYCRKFDF